MQKSFPADVSLKYNEQNQLIPTFLNNNKINGELYAYLLTHSYGDKDLGTVIYKKSLPSQEKIGEALGTSRRTIINHLNYLKELGYLIEDSIKKLYILPNKEESYFQVPQDTLDYLQDVVKDPVIKTYIYLGQRDKYKKVKENSTYVFTIKEICEHLGLNYQRNHKTIRNYLIALNKFELIDYVEFYEGNLPKIRLLWVKTECPKKKS